MKSKVVLVITDHETNAQVAKLGVDLLELRVDLFKKRGVEHAVAQFKNRRKLGLPLLLTVRNQKKEGARRDMSDARKLELLQALVPLTDWLDIELSSPLCAKAVQLARQHRKKVVVSAHDFKGMPAHLEQILKKGLNAGGDMVKIAAHANSQEDFLRMLTFTHQNRKHPLITMCVGPMGAVSRLVLPAVGSRWVYTFAHKPTAPGQLDIRTLKALS